MSNDIDSTARKIYRRVSADRQRRTQAYQAAYGVGADSARASAPNLLKNAKVQARLSELQTAVTNEKILTAQEIQTLLSAIGRREVQEILYLPNGEQVQRPVSVKDSIAAL